MTYFYVILSTIIDIWCSFFCMGFWYSSILISLYRIPPRENKRSYHFVTKQRKNTIYSFLPRIKAQNALHQQRHIHGCVSDENRNDNRLLSTVIRYVQELRWSCFQLNFVYMPQQDLWRFVQLCLSFLCFTMNSWDI